MKTPSWIAEIRARAEAATQGEWRIDHQYEMMAGKRHAVLRPQGDPLLFGHVGPVVMFADGSLRYDEGAYEDAEFVGHALEDIKRLLEELDEALEVAPCGHPAACIESDDKGTKCCGWCVAESEANRLRADLAREKSSLKCAFAYSEGLEHERDELRAEIATLESNMKDIEYDAGTDPLGKILNMISAELDGFAIAGEPINMAVRRLRKMQDEFADAYEMGWSDAAHGKPNATNEQPAELQEAYSRGYAGYLQKKIEESSID